MAASATDYTTITNIGTYAPDVNTTANTTILTSLIHAASRYIDSKCGQFFYREQTLTKFWPLVDVAGNMQGDRQITIKQPFFPAKIGTIAPASAGATSLTYTATDGVAPLVNDVFVLDDGLNAESVTVSNVSGGGPYTLTVPATTYAHGASTAAFLQLTIVLAYYENQPRSSWLTLNGDGKNPPSNYYLWPDNPKSYSSAGVTYYRPWRGVNLAHVPMPNTQFLPTGMGGYQTIAIGNCGWGWPAVHDSITDICNKMVVRAWKAREVGHTEQGGPAGFGAISMARHFDEKDLDLLHDSDLVAISL